MARYSAYSQYSNVIDLNSALSEHIDRMVEQKIREMFPKIIAEHCNFFHKKRILLVEKMKENGNG